MKITRREFAIGLASTAAASALPSGRQATAASVRSSFPIAAELDGIALQEGDTIIVSYGQRDQRMMRVTSKGSGRQYPAQAKEARNAADAANRAAPPVAEAPHLADVRAYVSRAGRS